MSNAPRAGMAPPLPRAWLDTIAGPLRALFGLIFIAWSWISTILILGRLLRPVLPGALIGGLPDRYLIALGVALLVTLAEFASSGRWPKAYWIVLIVGDASFTTVQTQVWLIAIVGAQMTIDLPAHAMIWLAAAIGGVVAAKFGEVLLFGTPRREKLEDGHGRRAQ